MEAAWAASQVPAVMFLYTECAVLCKDELIAIGRDVAATLASAWNSSRMATVPAVRLSLGYSSSAELLINRVARSGVRKNNGARRARLWPCAEGDGACSGSCRLGDARELRFSGRA